MEIRELIKLKIREYISLLKQCNLVTNSGILESIEIKLNELEIIELEDSAGDSMVTGNKLYICMKNIERNMNKYGKYYFDEVLFHEFAHISNSFHESIYGEKSFDIRECFEHNFDNFTTVELLEQEEKLLYNQDPYLGVILIDEYIAQHIAQQLVMKKYDYLNEKEKRQYFYDENLTKYKERIIITNMCIPPERIRTSLACYPEFDIFASEIIKKYGYDKENFIKDSLHKDMVRELISNCKKNYQLQSLYKDLCYLGIIKERIYLLKGFKKIDDKLDPANNPYAVHKTMMKVLNK